LNSIIQKIPIQHSSVSLNILRLDEIHPLIQGNKYYKLLYNIQFAIKNNLSIVTFGGAFSNHIHAVSLACKKHNIKCYGIIRGNNFKFKSTTLLDAENNGMQLIYTERALFKELRTANHVKISSWLQNNYAIPPNIHIVPEGGSNEKGIKGAEKILDEINIQFDYIVCPVGTGGTLAGIINASKGEKEIIGISSLKDNYLNNEISKFTDNKYKNWVVNYDYHFGGYAKWNKDLIHFINQFKADYQIPLCPIYTGKMMFGIIDLLSKNYFKENTTIIAIHTGGLQGIKGFNSTNKHILI